MAYDGSVRVSTAMDTDGIDKGVNATKKKLQAIETAFNAVNRTIIKQDAEVQRLTDNYVKAANAVEEIKNKMEAAQQAAKYSRDPETQMKAIEEAKTLSMEYEKANKELSKMGLEAEKAEGKLERLSAEADALKSAYEAISTDASLEEFAQSSADASKESFTEVANAIGKIGQAAQSASRITVSAFKAIGGTIAGIAKGAARVTRGIFSMMPGIRNIGRESRRSSGGIERLGKRILRLAAAAFVFNVIRRGLRSISDGLGSVLKQNEQFSSSINAIKVNMLTAFAPIYQTALPYIIAGMQKLAELTAVVAQLFARLFGTTYSQARDSAEVLYEQAKATDALGKSAKGASKSLASFDEVNTLAAETAADTGDGLSFDFEAPDVSWIDEFADKLKSIFTEFDPSYWIEFGVSIGDKIMGWLDKIPWNQIQGWASTFGGNLASILNGILSYDFGYAWGRTLAEALNTAVEFMASFAETLDWNKVGETIAGYVNGFFENFNFIRLAQAINAWAIGMLDAVISSVVRINWTLVGEKIAELLANINWFEILGKSGTAFAGFINGIVETLTTLAENTNFTMLGVALALVINNFFSDFDPLRLAQGISAWAKGLLTFIITILKNTDWAAIGTSLRVLLTNIDWSGIIDGLLKILQLAFSGIHDFLMHLFGSDLSDAWKISFDILLGIVSGFMTAMMLGFGPVGIIVGVIAGLAAAIISLGNSFGWFKDIIPEVQRFGSEISNATKYMLNPIIDNADLAREKLRSVFEDGKPIIAADAQEITGYFTKMADDAIYELERQKNAALAWAAEAFGKEAADYEARLAVVNKTYDAMIADIERHAAKLDEAALKAAATFGRESDEYKTAQKEYEKYANSIESETAKINNARDDELSKTLDNFGEQAKAWEEQKQTISQTYDEQIDTVRTKNEEQYQIIAEKLKEGEVLTETSYNDLLGIVESGLSDIQDVLVTDADERQSIAETRNTDLLNEQKRHASELLQEYAKDRDEAINNANKKYGELEIQARRMFYNGELTRDAYYEMKKSYEGDRDDAIAIARKKYDGLVTETTKGMDGIEKEINLANGKIETNWSKFWNGLFDGIWSGLKSFGTSIGNFFSNLFNTGSSGSIQRGGGSPSITPVTFSSFATPDIQVPKLARGGIVSSATIAMIGERGREAVVPLERNTEWMDTLVSGIVNGLTQSLAGIMSPGVGANDLSQRDIVMEMDSERFARLITPKVLNEFSRLGITPV